MLISAGVLFVKEFSSIGSRGGTIGFGETLEKSDEVRRIQRELVIGSEDSKSWSSRNALFKAWEY